MFNGNVKQSYSPIGSLTFYQISQNTQVAGIYLIIWM